MFPRLVYVLIMEIARFRHSATKLRTMFPRLVYVCCFCVLMMVIARFRHSATKFLNLEEVETQYLQLSPIEKIRYDCGELCDTSRQGIPGPYFDHVTAKVNCDRIFRNSHIDSGHYQEHAPNEIPENLLKHYTMNGRIPVTKWYFDQQYLGKKALESVWTKADIERKILEARRGKLGGSYDKSETNALRDGLRHTPGLQNGRVLVIGSERPWVEACALEAGAREVVTLEYGRIKSTHPAVKTMVPSEFRNSFLNKTLGMFDAVVTFSSVEHSGLGRYGDALNPWGDILSIARGWCVTRDGGGLAIGVMFDYDNDKIEFNAHRVYGKIRYPYLTTNWKQIYEGRGLQRVYVFEK